MSRVNIDQETRDAKRQRLEVEDDPVLVTGQKIITDAAFVVMDVVASTAEAEAEAEASTSLVATPAIEVELPTAAAVAEQLWRIDFVGQRGPIANAEALQALATMAEWARMRSEQNSFATHFHRYGGTARVLDALRENMSDAEMVMSICSILSSCMLKKSLKVATNIQDIQTLLLANDEYSATHTELGMRTTLTIWNCLSRATVEIDKHATKKEQAALVADAACDWIEKLSTFTSNTPQTMKFAGYLLKTLTSLSSQVRTITVVPAALRVAVSTIGMCKGHEATARYVGSFFVECSKERSKKNGVSMLSNSQYEALLQVYVEHLTEFPLRRRISAQAIEFLEAAAKFVDKEVMIKSRICAALSQYDLTDTEDLDLKQRARSLVAQLFGKRPLQQVPTVRGATRFGEIRQRTVRPPQKNRLQLLKRS